jgi:nicotinate-nucleotide--dimethylbenzimidazole phosphoribosyltransferase
MMHPTSRAAQDHFAPAAPLVYVALRSSRRSSIQGVDVSSVPTVLRGSSSVMADRKELISPIANAPLESGLRARLRHIADPGGPLDPVEELALRVGLIQNRLEPHFSTPDLVIFAADHGLAVDNIAGSEVRTTAATVHCLVTEQLPLASLSRLQGLRLMVVDSGIADSVVPHEHLHPRKIAHGTRNSRFGQSMSIEQVQAAIRAGIEIGESLDGNAVACAGIGVGSAQSAALVLASLSQVPLREFADAGPSMPEGLLDHTIHVLEGARQRHHDLNDPIELLAAMGGFEVAMMVGLLLTSAARRFVILPDGLPACAAVMVASALAPAVVEYCVFARSNRLPGLDRALSLFGTNAVLEVDMDAIDGTGATLTWPLILSAAALLARTD